ncbi:MAG: M24 family metallopeptidase, partial [Planctomycetota bacterium]
MARATAPGVAVGDLDRIASEVLSAFGARSAMRGYEDGHGSGPFPLSLSVCINDEASGACDPSRVIEHGDLVTADVAAELDGWYADAAVSWCVGGAAADPRRAALAAAAGLVAHAGVTSLTRSTSWAAALERMHRTAEHCGVVILEGWCGHGIGRAMHERPALPSRLRPGDPGRSANWGLSRQGAITIEPIIAWTQSDLVRDGWLDRTADGSDACFAERTVVLEPDHA